MNDKVLWVRGGAGQKRAYARTAFRQVLRVPQITVQPRRKKSHQSTLGAKNIIMLHGWSLDASGVSDFTRALEQLPGAADWNFWDISYDTQWTPFSVSARRIAQTLHHQHNDFSENILIGYSMGGVVARRLVADGFPCRALVSLCTPHEGFVPWVVRFGRGPRSISRSSHTLDALNRNDIDRAARSRYHFFALTYTDPLGRHQHDGVVPLSSALGQHLGPVAHREIRQLHYRHVATYDPHWRGKDPKVMTPAVRKIEELM